MSKDFKPVKVEDFDLSPEDMKTLVAGAQQFFPPADEEGEPILPAKKDSHAD